MRDSFKLQAGTRTIEIQVSDTIGPEDCYETLFKGVLHRYATGEDVVQPVPRSVKDAIIKPNVE